MNPEVVTEFSIGTKPYSDAYAWYQGSYYIREGHYLSGVSSRRPLYPIFLSTLSFILNDNYNAILLTQIFLYTLVAFLAVYFMAQDSLITAFVFGLYLVWLGPELPSLFLTENLGLFLSIPALSFTFYALSKSNLRLLAFSFFLLGLAQIARPFALVTIISLPLMAAFLKTTTKDRIKIVFLMACSIIVAPLLFQLYIRINFIPDASDSYSPVLYGLAYGGMSWKASETELEVIEARKMGKNESEVNRIIRKLAINKFTQEPKLFLKTIYPSYRAAWKNIRSLFSNSGFIVKNAYIVTFILGVLYILFNRHDKSCLFLIFYYAGLILSIPLIGKDGGQRVQAASFPVYIMTSVFGLRWILKIIGFKDGFLPWGIKPRTINLIVIPFKSMILVSLIIIPTFIFYRTQPLNSKADNSFKYDLTHKSYSSDLIEEQNIWDELNKWPDSDFEQFDNKYLFVEMNFYKSRFNYFGAGQGIDEKIPTYKIYYWPASKKTYDRYIGWNTLKSGHTMWIEIPKILIEDRINLLDGKKIGIAGQIVTRQIDWRYDTFISLIAKEIFF